MSRWPLLGEGDRGGGGVGLLLETKLRGFSPSPEMIVRPRLSARLIGSDASLVLFAAPPGFGKTTLLAQWRELDERPFAWFTADSADSDPVALWTGIVEAIRARAPGFRRRRRGRAPGPPRRRARRADPGRRPRARVASGRARPRPRRLPGGRQRGLPRLARLLHGGEAEERPARASRAAPIRRFRSRSSAPTRACSSCARSTSVSRRTRRRSS